MCICFEPFWNRVWHSLCISSSSGAGRAACSCCSAPGCGTWGGISGPIRRGRECGRGEVWPLLQGENSSMDTSLYALPLPRQHRPFHQWEPSWLWPIVLCCAVDPSSCLWTLTQLDEEESAVQSCYHVDTCRLLSSVCVHDSSTVWSYNAYIPDSFCSHRTVWDCRFTGSLPPRRPSLSLSLRRPNVCAVDVSGLFGLELECVVHPSALGVSLSDSRQYLLLAADRLPLWPYLHPGHHHLPAAPAVYPWGGHSSEYSVMELYVIWTELKSSRDKKQFHITVWIG